MVICQVVIASKKIFAVVEVCDRWFYIFNFTTAITFGHPPGPPDMKCAKIPFPIRTVLVLF